MVLFYHNNYYIGFSQQKAYWFLVSLFSWCGFDYAQPPKVEIIFFSPTLTSTTLSHRGGKLFYCMFLCFIFWNAKIFYYSYIFKGAKLAKFIRFEALWKLYIFYHKVLGDVVKTMALLRALRNIGNCEDVKLKYFAFWRDSSLCCASFRMTRFCFFTHD